MYWITVDSDEVKKSSKLPDLGFYAEQTDLEALTGADFVIAFLPLPIDPQTLETHIKSRALFVQRKSGYDILSFDRLKTSIARMHEAGIPPEQSILLFIGRDWQDEAGKFRVENQKPYGELKYQDFITLKAKWRSRGGVVDWINSEDQLEAWIESQVKVVESAKGPREIYPPASGPVRLPGEYPWEPLIEVDKDDMRYFLVAGLHGFGPKLAASVLEHIKETVPHLSGYGVYYLKALTDEDEAGRGKFNIKGWGNKSRRRLRRILGLANGYNLGVKEITEDPGNLAHGWYGALRAFAKLLEEGYNPRDAWDSLMRQANEFYKEEGIDNDD